MRGFLHRLRAWIGLPDVFLILAPFIAVVLALGQVLCQHVIVTSIKATRHVALGRPFTWIVQNQDSLTPPHSLSVGFGNPYENPTHAIPAGFAGDVAFWFVVLLVAAVALTRMIYVFRRRSKINRAAAAILR